MATVSDLVSWLTDPELSRPRRAGNTHHRRNRPGRTIRQFNRLSARMFQAKRRMQGVLFPAMHEVAAKIAAHIAAEHRAD
jgi:hypothetical protein